MIKHLTISFETYVSLRRLTCLTILAGLHSTFDLSASLPQCRNCWFSLGFVSRSCLWLRRCQGH